MSYIKDENGKNYFDRLREQMLRNRNERVSKPVVPIINNKGTIMNARVLSNSIDAKRFDSINNQVIPKTFY